MFLRSRVVGITASSPWLQRAYPFIWHVWHKCMGCRVCGFDSSAWIVCIYRWRVRLVMNTTFLEKGKLSLNLGVVILRQNSLGGGCTSGAPLISDLLPRWLYALLQFRFIWCCFGLGCVMPSFSWWLGKRSAYLVVCAPPTWGPVTLHRLQTLLLRERGKLVAQCIVGSQWPPFYVTCFSAWPRAGNSGKRVRKRVLNAAQFKKRSYLGGLGGGNSNMLKNFAPRKLGEDVHPFWRLHIFFRWVGSTTNQIWPVCCYEPNW